MNEALDSIWNAVDSFKKAGTGYTFKVRQGYRYYVYLGPGRIEYFTDYPKAKQYADHWGAEVKELE